MANYPAIPGPRYYGYVPKRVYQKEALGLDVISYGVSNTYPQEMELAVKRSPTATACHKVFYEFLYGNGFADETVGATVVNAKGETMNELLLQVCKQFALFNGFGLILNANLLGEYSSIELNDFTQVRLCIPEDRVNPVFDSAKISDNWAGESWRQDATFYDAKYIHLFNPNTLQDELAAYDSIADYPGQLLYYTGNRGIYPECFFDSAIESVLLEGDIAEFDRRYVNNGYSGSIVLTTDVESPSQEAFDNIVNEIRKMGGQRNAGGIHYMEGGIRQVPISAENMTDQYLAVSEAAARKVIVSTGTPSILVSEARQGGFPNQEELVNAYTYYNGQTAMYRQQISKQFAKIAQNFAYTIGDDFSIEPKTFDNGGTAS